MHIYNYKQNSQSPHHILDPDYTYHTSYEAEILYHFFKNLIIPQNINTMASIYIEYQVLPFLFEKYPFIYQNFAIYSQRNYAIFRLRKCKPLYESNKHVFHYYV